MPLSWLFDYQRIGADLVAELDEGHLGHQPAGVFGNPFHRFSRIVTNQVNTFGEQQEGLKSSAHPVSGKFKISNLILLVHQTRAQRAGIGQEILFESVLSRADVSQHMPRVLSQRDDCPLVEYRLAIPYVHLRGAILNYLCCLVERHRVSGVFRAKVSNFETSEQGNSRLPVTPGAAA